MGYEIRYEEFDVMTEIDLAYFAGIFDGEGCVSIQPNKGQLTLTVDVVNTNFEVIENMHKYLGGHLSLRTQNKISPMRVWYVRGHKCAESLKPLIPYLHIKREQALLAIEFSKTIGNPPCKLSEDIKIWRNEAYKKMKTLNSRRGRY